MSLKIYRGLIIVKPYGTLIKNKKKNLIVKSKNIKSIINVNLLLIENKIGLGIIKLGNSKKINLKEFKKLEKFHKIKKEDRIKWWTKYKNLYAYPIIETKFYGKPLLIVYPTGPQITIIPNNIIIKKIYIGISGYYYKNMYPVGVKNLLEYYSNNFYSVEINSSFYHLPSKSFIDNLKKYDLVYSIKVNKYITHNKKLKNVKKYWLDFYKII